MEEKFVFAFLGLLTAVATAAVLGVTMDNLGFDFGFIRANALTSAGLVGVGLASDVLLTWN